MLRTFIEIVSKYNNSMNKNKHTKHTTNKINVFYKKLLCKQPGTRELRHFWN